MRVQATAPAKFAHDGRGPERPCQVTNLSPWCSTASTADVCVFAVLACKSFEFTADSKWVILCKIVKWVPFTPRRSKTDPPLLCHLM